jgi:hypothetical protein
MDTLRKDGRAGVMRVRAGAAWELGGGSNQPHPGTRTHCYRCSLPGLAGFTANHCEGTGKSHHCETRADYSCFDEVLQVGLQR